ncbi:MAG: preprotein translocase subunit SecG [bacterium]|nr:preprotein translocase subunit SecG [bacterium]MDD3804679.1 preprotein translocase subunit SecG [bacterium]MDD4153003.1 preprotein translocase subunit SecG [bacterium]MDD4558086.1 preprotein translocase subunit SecG [bacterium]
MGIVMIIVHILICIGLIVVVLMQNTKSEGGLSGAITGWSQHAKSRYGIEEKLDRFTLGLAIAFFASALVMYLIYPIFL